ncbi:MAG: phospholipase, partial [Syntrophales bacterium LBB04]|nr:phospholipase [Syntrophales bacterium LBB04]
ISFIILAQRRDFVLNTIVAGEYWGISVGVSRISRSVMKVAQDRMLHTNAKLTSNDFSELTYDDIFGEILFYTAMLYEARMDGHDTVLARSLGVKALRLPSEAVFKSTLQVNCIFGVPVSAKAGGLMMDVGRQLSLVKAYDGDNAKKLDFMRYSGINSSVFEHRVPEQLFSSVSAVGISAVKALQIANDSRIPIYTITKNNISIVLPQLQLDAMVIDDIRNAVNAGKEVTVSKTNISHRGWVGCGYVITDPIAGSGYFMISGEQRGAYILITTIGILTGNPVVITAGLGLLSEDIFVDAFAKLAGIGTTEPTDWCGSNGSEWVPDYPFGIDATEACKKHDQCYNAGVTSTDKLICDGLLGLDLYDDCIGQDRNILLCGIVSDTYQAAVAILA